MSTNTPALATTFRNSYLLFDVPTYMHYYGKHDQPPLMLYVPSVGNSDRLADIQELMNSAISGRLGSCQTPLKVLGAEGTYEYQGAKEYLSEAGPKKFDPEKPNYGRLCILHILSKGSPSVDDSTIYSLILRKASAFDQLPDLVKKSPKLIQLSVIFDDMLVNAQRSPSHLYKMTRLWEACAEHSALKTISFLNNDITDEDVSRLTKAYKSKGHSPLEVLSLEWNLITAHGLHRLLTLKVVHLSVSSNKIGESVDGLDQTLMRNSVLRILDLTFNRIGPLLLKQLSCSLLHNRTLKEIRLSADVLGAGQEQERIIRNNLREPESIDAILIRVLLRPGTPLQPSTLPAQSKGPTVQLQPGNAAITPAQPNRAIHLPPFSRLPRANPKTYIALLICCLFIITLRSLHNYS